MFTLSGVKVYVLVTGIRFYMYEFNLSRSQIRVQFLCLNVFSSVGAVVKY